MIYFPELSFATFLERKNRFVVAAAYKGEELPFHCPNSGRLTELFLPGRALGVVLHLDPKKKTKGRILLVNHTDWVVIDSMVPNALIGKALQEKSLPFLTDCPPMQSEVSFQGSRFDFGNLREKVLIECKSVTLCEEGVALFPDAPTKRGQKHLFELTQARKLGYRCLVIFVVTRRDAYSFTPHKARDPAFYEQAKQAKAAGVRFHAVNCQVDPFHIAIQEELEVIL